MHLARRALDDPNTAAIEGIVYDSVHHRFVDGATVIVSSAALPHGSHTAISDDNGDYVASDLPPGAYTVTLYLGDFTTGIRNVDLAAGYATRVDLTVDREFHLGGETHRFATGSADRRSADR